MKTTVTLTQQEMIDVLKKYYSIQYMTEVDVVLLPTEKEEPKSTLWYPDNSGEWIESGFNLPHGLTSLTPVQTLTKSERHRQQWNPCVRLPAIVCWSDVVAYRIVKEPILWYPDDSGEWIECDGKKPSHLPADTVVYTLSGVERRDRVMHNSHAKEISWWNWNAMVAYRVAR